MSTGLYWKPVVPQDEYWLPDALKFKLARRIWDEDGSLGCDETVLNAGFIPYLEGLADAGVDGAGDLIAAIKKHGGVSIRITS